MVSPNRTAVVLITEDPMVEIAVRHLFGGDHHNFYVHTALSFKALTEMPPVAGADIVLADVSHAEHSDFAVAVRRQIPGSPVLWWCGSAALTVAHLRQSGEGVISRLAPGPDLMAALLQLIPQTQGVQTKNAREVKIHLTYREGQLVALLARGYSNKEIAACLGITVGTVKVYLSTLFKKTGAKDRFELTMFGVKNSLYGVAEVSCPVPVQVAARRAISHPVLRSMRLVRLPLLPVHSREAPSDL